jgi:hypothetical protein
MGSNGSLPRNLSSHAMHDSRCCSALGFRHSSWTPPFEVQSIEEIGDEVAHEIHQLVDCEENLHICFQHGVYHALVKKVTRGEIFREFCEGREIWACKWRLLILHNKNINGISFWEHGNFWCSWQLNQQKQSSLEACLWMKMIFYQNYEDFVSCRVYSC